MRNIQLKVKRIFDVMVSLFIIIPFLPLWIFIGILIKKDSEGPIFFLQDRPGYKGRIFKIYKYRTMKPDSDIRIKGKEVSLDDDRITKIGKILRRTKLDEIPQTLNVLKGDMSLVGPRPERPESLKDYDEEIKKRLDMKPGMTGLAQVSGNIHLSLNDRYKFDVKYVEKFNLLLDFFIIIKTVFVIIFGEDKLKK
ncbi:sugar transferase [Macrococcoides caseolyticum]|uniref:sugar transferase n=1 Tax=Macrococcoides caseolyticum TaxID=69966 RepID=UPI000C33E647|nr:sugar transferase [Macrococcus caseolyticus]PKF46214.1 sugar transferase [Macrococcus caseolyticus]